MKRNAIYALLVFSCCWFLTASSCARRMTASAPAPVPVAARPAADTTATPESNEPLSVPQTQVVLPNPQPIQADALATQPAEVPPAQETPNQVTKPRVTPPKQEQRTQTGGPGVAAGPPPPPAVTPGSRRRIRPVESVTERRRLEGDVAKRQRQVRDVLAKVKARPLSEAEKSTTERIQGFLDQTAAALKENDLQQADALSKRALLLCQELNAQ